MRLILMAYTQPTGDRFLMQLHWLPVCEDWDSQLRAVKDLAPTEVGLVLRELASSRMEFAQVGKLDRVLGRAAGGETLPGLERVRLAILGSATTSHLPSGIRVAGLRRGLQIEVY